MTKHRVGPKMAEAVECVREAGALPSKLALAEAVGPHGSRYYGYRIVERCLAAGLLALDSAHPLASARGLGAVVLSER